MSHGDCVCCEEYTTRLAWVGPCAHGRDPWDRCDVCGEGRQEWALLAAWEAVCREREALTVVLTRAEGELGLARAEAKKQREALEALVAGVEDMCELYRRCDVAACNCGRSHPTLLGERVRRARIVIGWDACPHPCRRCGGRCEDPEHAGPCGECGR